MKPNRDAGHMTRRDFVRSTAAIASIPLTPRMRLGQQVNGPSFTLGGVQIGAITYSFRALPSTADNLLSYLVQCGIDTIELMGGPAEEFAGAPPFEGPGWPRRGEQITEEQRAQLRAAREAHARRMSEWRTSVSMSRFEALRTRYNDAGVGIHVVKFADIGPTMAEEEVHYCFNAANALGAQGITTEISEEKAIFLAPFAAEHQIMVGFHNHTQVNAASWEAPLSHGKFLGVNLDVGHYVAGTNESPIPVIERYADAGRIVNLHMKDRKVNNGPNMPFGEGDTPLALILQLMKRKGYTFPADIELEYEVPRESNPVAEVQRCLEFCRTALADPPA